MKTLVGTGVFGTLVFRWGFLTVTTQCAKDVLTSLTTKSKDALEFIDLTTIDNMCKKAIDKAAVDIQDEAVIAIPTALEA